jgi:hypothetical protein
MRVDVEVDVGGGIFFKNIIVVSNAMIWAMEKNLLVGQKIVPPFYPFPSFSQFFQFRIILGVQVEILGLY